MGRDAGDSCEAEVCDAGSPVLVDQDVRLRVRARYKYGGISFEEKLYPFQISVDNAKAMHILQSLRNAD